MRKLVILVLVLLLLAGGAVYTGLANPVIAWRIKNALVDAGIGEQRAECMANRMVTRLSVVQLYQLRQGIAPQAGEPEIVDGFGELVKRLRRVEDGEAVAVFTTSAGLCALGIG